jgi:pyridoxine 5-phosphate synthase
MEELNLKTGSKSFESKRGFTLDIRLSVNVDHVASLREARRSKEPDPVHAAVLAKLGGADGVTVHLRKDRRHIKERDVMLIKEVVQLPLTVEMGLFDDILEFVIQVVPYKVTLVPERVEEVTTEGGMDLSDKKIRELVIKFSSALKEKGVRVGVFIDPENRMVDYALECGLSFVEVNTTAYSRNPSDKDELRKIRESARYAFEKGLEVMAGHELNIHNVSNIAQILEIEELSIGHSIVSRSIFLGFEKAVQEMKEKMIKSRMLALLNSV